MCMYQHYHFITIIIIITITYLCPLLSDCYSSVAKVYSLLAIFLSTLSTLFQSHYLFSRQSLYRPSVRCAKFRSLSFYKVRCVMIKKYNGSVLFYIIAFATFSNLSWSYSNNTCWYSVFIVCHNFNTSSTLNVLTKFIVITI